LPHLAFLLMYVLPFISVIIQLRILFSDKGTTDQFVRDNTREAMNLFVFSCLMVLLSILLFVVTIGYFLLIVLGIYLLVFPIIAAIKTAKSTTDSPVYRYPMIFRLLK